MRCAWLPSRQKTERTWLFLVFPKYDNTAAKMFVCFSVQDLFFCVLERFTFFFGAILFSKVLCFRSSSSLIGAFSPKTRPGNPSKCEFVMHFDDFLV